MRSLLDAVEFGLMVVGPGERIQVANRWLRERVRTPLAGRTLDEALPGQVDPRLRLAIRECLNSGRAMRLSHAFHPMPLPLFAPQSVHEQRMRHAVDVIPVLDAAGQRECLVQIRDMSEIARRETILKEQSRRLSVELERVSATQNELTRQTLRFREMTRLAPVGLIETDIRGTLTYCNDRAAEMLRLEAPSALGRLWLELLPEADTQRLTPKWNAAVSARVRFADELQLHHKGGATLWLRIEAGPVRTPQGLADVYIGTITDVTEFHQHAQRYEYRANHDVLTGLLNRERFEQQLVEALSAATHSGKPLAVLFLDLNQFKPINDVHGHSAGDLVLKAVAGRMRTCLRNDDAVGRIGGDEFAVLLPNAPDRATLEQMLAKLIRSVGLPVSIGTGHVRVTCSGGVALFPKDGRTADELLKVADRAMYQHKFRNRSPEEIALGRTLPMALQPPPVSEPDTCLEPTFRLE